MKRAWVIGGTVLLLVVVGAVTFTREGGTCGDSVTSLPASRSRSPFLDAAGRAEQPDHDRDTLVARLAADPAPVGEVVGAVGYHYEQWAHVSAYAQGIGVRTRDNPDFTMLDGDTLAPLWSVQVATRRSTYDASDRSYVVATLPEKSAPDLVAVDADTGRRRWCTTLGAAPVRGRDRLATQFLDHDDVAVLAHGRLRRISGTDGRSRWTATQRAGDGDFLGDLGEGVLLAGGVDRATVLDRPGVADRAAGTALAGVSADTGRTRWSRETPAGTADRVIGTDPDHGTGVVEEWGASGPGRILALDRDGRQAWTISPGAAGFDATLRSGRLLVRSGSRWAAYDVRDGHQLWRRTVPDRSQFLPYGFELDTVPLLDADHALLGTTTALRTLDLRDGSMTSAPLPTDGISTTYWPYEVAVTDRLIALATNTGAVVVRREGFTS